MGYRSTVNPRIVPLQILGIGFIIGVGACGGRGETKTVESADAATLMPDAASVAPPGPDLRIQPDLDETSAPSRPDASVDNAPQIEDAGHTVDAGPLVDGTLSPPDVAGDAPVSPPDVPASVDANVARPLPLLLIVTADGGTIGESNKTSGTLKIIEVHDGTLKAPDQLTPSFMSNIGIELRGAPYPKRSYGFELRTAADKDRTHALLGMSPESDWILYGCYSDKTCLRDTLGYELGRGLGRWTPSTRFAEVYLNGKYQGLFSLVERIKQNSARVDVPKPADNAVLGDLTGGYIFRLEGAGEGKPSDLVAHDWVSTVGKLVYSYHFPKFDKITPAQRFYLQGQVSTAEQAMRAATFADPKIGYPAYFDVASLVDFALMQELSGNVNGYGKSAYFHKLPKTKGDKIVAGPFWDFDGAFGNDDEHDGYRSDRFAYEANRFGSVPTPYSPPGTVGFVPFFWEKLWADPEFRAAAVCRWQSMRRGAWMSSSVASLLSAWQLQIVAAQQRDQAVWKTVGQKIGHGYFVGTTLADDLRWLRDWVNNRITWLDAQLDGVCPT